MLISVGTIRILIDAMEMRHCLLTAAAKPSRLNPKEISNG
jgi:hypothetical protein